MNKEKLLESFLGDARVRDFLSYSDDINLFSILSIDEIRHSNMLGWLLNPRGSHLFGDYFLKAVLYSAYSSIDNDPKYKSIAQDWSYSELESISLQNAIVDREWRPDKSNRIDFFIYDVDHDLEIFIENKIESPYNKEQLNRYLKVIPKHQPGAKYKLHIFMHYYETEARKARFPWIGLTYDWLIDAIEKRPNNSIPDYTHIDRILDFYADWLADRFTFRNQKAIEDAASYINDKYGTFLKLLKEEIKDTSKLVSKIFNEEELPSLYARHCEKFDYLFDFSGWEYLGWQMQARLSEYSLDYSFGQNWLNIHLDSWYKHYKNRNDETFWLYIIIKEQEPPRHSLNKIHYEIILYTNLDHITDTSADKLRNVFAKTYKRKQLLKSTISIPNSEDVQQSQSLFLQEVIPEIRKLIKQVNSALG